MLLLSAAAFAASGWSGAHGGPEVGRPRTAAVAAGLGGSFLIGQNGAGYDPGLAERLVFDVAIGRSSAFTVELDHARHALADAGAYFPTTDAPAGALTGFRDYLVVDAGFRLGIDLADERYATDGRIRGGGPRPPRGPPSCVRAVPYLRLGVGAAFTTTLLDAPGMDGRLALRSRTAWPAPSVGAGVEVRIRRWITLLPQLKTQVQVFEDVAESTGGETHVAAEWRLQPALDVSINF